MQKVSDLNFNLPIRNDQSNGLQVFDNKPIIKIAQRCLSVLQTLGSASTPAGKERFAIVSLQQQKESIQKETSQLQALRSQLKNPIHPIDSFYSQFESLFGKTEVEAFHQCFNDPSALKSNPRLLLNIRNRSGQNILDAWIEEKQKRTKYLSDLICLSLLRNESDPKIVKQLLADLSEKTRLRLIAKSGKTVDRIKSWQTENHSFFIDAAATKCVIKMMKTLENKIEDSFTFEATHVVEGSFERGDSHKVIEALNRSHQLQSFHALLTTTPPVDKEEIYHAFLQLDEEIRIFFFQLVHLASFSPFEERFSEKLLSSNPYFLLQCQNKKGVDIVAQTVGFLQRRLKLERMQPEIKNMSERLSKAHSDQQKLEIFEKASSVVRDAIGYLIWWNAGGKENPSFGEYGYGNHQIYANPSLIKQQCDLLDEMSRLSLQDYRNTLAAHGLGVPSGPISCSPLALAKDSSLLQEVPDRVIMVAIEGFLSVGGVGVAIRGLAKNLSESNVHVKIIQAKFDTIPVDTQQKMIEKPKYTIQVMSKDYKVFKLKDGILRYYFLENLEHFTVGFNAQGKPNSIYFGADKVPYRRWAHFQAEAAELAYRFSKNPKHPAHLLHLHCNHSALVSAMIKEHHPQEWAKGETPATVFTYHGFADHIWYKQVEEPILKNVGLSIPVVQSLVRGVEDSDILTTVSESFAEEMQTPVSGDGIADTFKRKAWEKKFYGIPNGNTDTWNPKTNLQLKNWINQKGESQDLTYGPEDTHLAEQLMKAREELVYHLAEHKLVSLDLHKPIFGFIGRFDSSTKGIDKFLLITQEIVKNGGQVIFMGVDPDPDADRMLQKVEDFAKTHPGVCVIRDFRRKDGRLYWQQGNTDTDKSGVQGFGPLFRAGIDAGLAPSLTESGGIATREMQQFGKIVVGTAVGGQKEAILAGVNGYPIFRHENWYSLEQDKAIREAVAKATIEMQERIHALYDSDPNRFKPYLEQIRTIMRESLSTWKYNVDGSLSIIDRYKLVYAQARRHHKNPRSISVDLKIDPL